MVEEELKKYIQVKKDLLKMAKCIESCEGQQKNLYQNVCLEFSKELKIMRRTLEALYGVEVCNCCSKNPN